MALTATGGGMDLVALLGIAPTSQIIAWTNVNGNPDFQVSQVTFEQNIADIQSNRNLNFHWQASSGQFFAEVVANSGTL